MKSVAACIVVIGLFGITALGCMNDQDQGPDLTSSSIKPTTLQAKAKTSPLPKQEKTKAKGGGADQVGYLDLQSGQASDYDDASVERDAEGHVESITLPNGRTKAVYGDGVDNGDGTESYSTGDGKEYTVKKGSDGSIPDASTPDDSTP